MVHAYITADAIHASTRNIYNSEIGSESTMCQVHTGAYVSLLAPGKTDYTACHPRKTTTYMSHAVSITTHTHDRPKSIGKKKQITNKKRKEKKEKRRKKKKRRKTKKERREKKKQVKQEKAKQEEEARKGKKEKKSY